MWDVSLPLTPLLLAELCKWCTSIQACAPGATVLLVGSHLDQAESAESAARSCAAVREHLTAALSAQTGRLEAELAMLDPERAGLDSEALWLRDHSRQSNGTPPTPAEKRVAQLVCLLATPLRLVPEPVVVSAKTLENFDRLRSALRDAVFDADAFPEVGALQPRSYEVVARRLEAVAAGGTPTLTWTGLADAGGGGDSTASAVEVVTAGSVAEASADGKEHRLFSFELRLEGMTVLTLELRYSQIHDRHKRLVSTGVLGLPAFPSSMLHAARDYVHGAANVARRAEELRQYWQALLQSEAAVAHPEFGAVLGFDLQSLRATLAQAFEKLRDWALLRRALLFLRATGEVLYYDNAPGLEDRIFIKPQWLVDVLKELVRHQPIEDQVIALEQRLPARATVQDKSAVRARARKFLKKGLLHESILPLVWADLLRDADPSLVRELAQLLEHLSIALPWTNAADGSCQWPVPLRLPSELPYDLPAEWSATGASEVCRLYDFGSDVPTGLAAALLNRCIELVKANVRCWKGGLIASPKEGLVWSRSGPRASVSESRAGAQSQRCTRSCSRRCRRSSRKCAGCSPHAGQAAPSRLLCWCGQNRTRCTTRATMATRGWWTASSGPGAASKQSKAPRCLWRSASTSAPPGRSQQLCGGSY